MSPDELQHELERRGLRPATFAAECMGCSRAAVTLWLAGKRRVPEAEVRAALRVWDRRCRRAYDRLMREAGHNMREAAKHLPRVAPIVQTTEPTAATVGSRTTNSLLAQEHPQYVP